MGLAVGGNTVGVWVGGTAVAVSVGGSDICVGEGTYVAVTEGCLVGIGGNAGK